MQFIKYFKNLFEQKSFVHTFEIIETVEQCLACMHFNKKKFCIKETVSLISSDPLCVALSYDCQHTYFCSRRAKNVFRGTVENRAFPLCMEGHFKLSLQSL